MYAVISTGGKQYNVSNGDVLNIEKIDANPGDTITIDNVLAVYGADEVLFGTPTVEGASVKCEVTEHVKGDKLIVFKMKKRKGYRKTTGHRQNLTTITIKSIDLKS